MAKIMAEVFVEAILKASSRKPRLTKPQVMPTEECPLPDHTKDMSNDEWVMLCCLVHSPLAEGGHDGKDTG